MHLGTGKGKVSFYGKNKVCVARE